ncbi:hypothetical protein AC1031_011307 [Aphanomyces cochlioides]|nr:hypothetical protein AC1031_011307 [Aphanomyces cochlioides]
MNPETFDAFVKQLVKSNWTSDGKDYTAGIQSLFQALPTTAITALDLPRNQMSLTQWKSLAHLLRESRLESLKLPFCALTNKKAILIAQAIKNNNTIKAVDLRSNEFGYEAARTLIECATDSMRTVQMEVIEIGGNPISCNEMENLQIFAAKRDVRTFIALVNEENSYHDDGNEGYTFVRRYDTVSDSSVEFDGSDDSNYEE